MIGVVLATEMEARPFLERLRQRGAVTPVGTSTWRVDREGVCLTVGVCGMGKTAAASGVEAFIDTWRPLEIINAGIAGGLSSEAEVGGLYRVTAAVDWPSDAAVAPSQTNPAFDDLPAATLVTSDKPVFDDELRARLATRGDIVDMEGSVVIGVCASRGVPCTLIKGISDTAKPGERDTLRANITRVSTQIAEALVTRLGIG